MKIAGKFLLVVASSMPALSGGADTRQRPVVCLDDHMPDYVMPYSQVDGKGVARVVTLSTKYFWRRNSSFTRGTFPYDESQCILMLVCVNTYACPGS